MAVTTSDPAESKKAARKASGSFLRTVWRTHFYAAIFSAPILILMSVTGLAILYTDTINDVTLHSLTHVEASGPARSLGSLRDAADAESPAGSHLVVVTTPKQPDLATIFQYTKDDATYTDVYVNQYTGEVTGTHRNGDDVVGWANRLHNYIGNKNITITLPALSHVFDPSSGELWQEYPVGDVIIEIAIGWALILAISGIYLWWPRRSEKGKALLKVRWSKGGRLRWRDVHAAAGILGATTFLIFIISGLPWSGYWGSAWSTAASKITPSHGAELFGGSATSTQAREGDTDRFGHRISWATREMQIPSSGSNSMPGMDMPGMDMGSSAGSSDMATASNQPAEASLDTIAAAAKQEGMRAGYTIAMPTNTTGEDGAVTYGSFALANPWPAQIQHEKTVYLDEFSAKTIERATASNYGALPAATEVGVLTHMGTQFGLINKIIMTAGCLLIITSVVTSIVMWAKRRPSGTAGLPKRPASPKLPWALVGIGVALAVIYPLWGLSLVFVVLVDRFVIQRVPRLRRAFNLRDK